MLVQITVVIDGREAGVATQEIPGTAAEIEEQTRALEQRAGRVILETGFDAIAQRASTPCYCRKNCGFRTIGILTTRGEVPVPRRRDRCLTCGHESYPADAQICCGRHRISRPLAMRVCQLATVEHFPHRPHMLSDQHGIRLGNETIIELAHDVGGSLDRRRRRPLIAGSSRPPDEESGSTTATDLRPCRWHDVLHQSDRTRPAAPRSEATDLAAGESRLHRLAGCR